MKNFLLLSAALVIGCAAFAADDWVLPAEQIQLKPVPGSDLVKANCMMCHSVDYIAIQPRFTRDQWKASVLKMQGKFGAPITAESVDPLVEYLVAAYGKSAQ
jgi:hypothetical protein